MEVSHCPLSPREQSGDPEHPQHESSHNSPQPTSSSEQQQAAHSQQQQHEPSQAKQTKRPRHERKRLRLQKKNVLEMETLEGDASTWAPGTSEDNMGVSGEKPTEVSASSVPAQACSMETQESTLKQKRARKPQKPGKYVCTYCGRACAKPSVLQKHIRSHTGERPYPCAPCGFSFKTKSNLYKHRKSHTHRVKAGLTTGREGQGGSCHEEPVTESDEDTGHPSSSFTLKNQGMIPSQITCTEVSPEGQSQGMEDSHAVKKRLAMRLSRGRRAPLGSSDEASSSFGLGSKGSTESGYFSRSESTEVSQESPPNTSAKSYAEVILGKFGRLGNLQRTARQQHEHPSGQEERSIPFAVPKKQVIDHITKLITINEAVVDTSKIDSVKPRRFSLSRKSSTESKASLSKETLLQSAKEISSKSSGSITLGVPCEKFQHQSVNVSQPADPSSTAPLMRSHSLPSDASAASTACSRSLRLSQSFEEQQPAHNRRHGMLRRQPAIELPIGAEINTEEQPSPSSSFHPSIPTVPDCKQKQLEPFECEACGVACKSWENYKTHKHHHCLGRLSHQLEIPTEEHGIFYKARPGALAMRKRRKEDSLELDDPALPSVALPSTFAPSQAYTAACEKSITESIGSSQANEKESALKGVSVIQHTSLFDKQEPTLRSQGTYEASIDKPPSHDGHHTSHAKEQMPTKPAFRKLVRQHNVQVPEILVTEDTDMPVSPRPDISEIKETEKIGDFQWPQRSPTLAQLPIEKLPPKKKRLRLAEAAQSSGDSSFESLSLPHSPSQDSSLSHTSSQSTSLEEPVKSDEMLSSRRSRALHTLAIPTGPHHPHREMRRSASEQAPHIPQQTNPIVEARSKSFDYSCLSPDRTPAGWRERRKCLLIRHSAVKEPEEEDITPKAVLSVNSSPPRTGISPRQSPGTFQSLGPSTSQNVSLGNIVHPLFAHKHVTQWQLNQPPGISENTMAIQKIPHNVLQVAPTTNTDQSEARESPQCPSGAARAHYSSVSTGLKLKIPMEDNIEESTANAHVVHLSHYHHYQHSHLEITPSHELLSPRGMQRVPVRLHSDLPLHVNTVYTTLSQKRSQDPSCSDVRLNTVASNFDVKEQRSVPEGSMSSGSGGNKRVLSPTSSVELSHDSQQQKRVKEEEDENNEQSNSNSLTASNKEERVLSAQCIISPISNKETQFPSLHTNPTSSWCYLNYIKPNPSAQSDNQNSVYSSWSVSTRNPNPPGLTSKEVLSLLYCKQRHSPFTYTMAAMPASTVGKPEVPDPRKPEESEVHAPQPNDRIEVQQAEPTVKEEPPKEEGEEEAWSTSKCSEIPRVQICEGGYRSNEEYVYVRGRGRGRYVCEECGIRCKKPSMLRKHIRLHTDARPYVCQHCNFAFKTKGNLTKHMKSKAHGKRCPEGTAPGPVQCEPETEEGGGGEHSVLPEVTEEHQFSDVEDTDEEEDEDNEEGDEEASRSSASSVSRSLSSEDPGSQASPVLLPKAQEPSVSPARPSKPIRAVSPNLSQYVETPVVGVPSSPLCSFSPGLHLSPALPRSPGRDTSPLHCLSPRLSLSPAPCQSSLSPSSRPVSPLSARHLSPVRALSPIRPASPSGPLSSVVGASVSVQQRPYRHRDPVKSSPSRFSLKTKLEKMCSPQRRGYQPSPPRGLLSRNGTAREGQRVLSHLPLHSQPLTPSACASLMIPIGGIQMVQSRSGLRPGLNSAQKTQPALRKQKEVKGSPSDQDHQRGSARGEHEDKKRDAPSVPLTTWKCISQRKERKRMDRATACRTSPLTHFHRSTLIKQNTSTDSVATPKSTWSERASSFSSARENSIRERSLVSVPGANAAKVDRIP
ncbi:transcription factor HIVEP3 [Pygocentrus nattereri]|uniref:HIVEP zinc finger 3a n=1 Tax=Pygocentrus nattereri TaxID=42514 RepID=A0A3B4CYD4_PYGNA|nr:transcription factor HIVEP3 [Pygocentrus nattereri]XP_037391002.1 transcription factor HIVEP3 [Pygocentrus nattereri]XP_037391032.1 transcription factor HIVEP3 [Pygocentrus nattereri]XP_037391058.1 transcription factor HIVEP3 [Pygocentrus nattereri]XP_037391073.1 transcription factor HIVEP3 [Pygocentrus nattereri]XP_037391092.1 transcription factor HIVEP3 [Pygocentrus nattereri]XP_037391106.1 transcription factor HIVEP3 [Pygocentrus nattereri]XP_037391141.1 transcription factor HIVEP3 [Py